MNKKGISLPNCIPFLNFFLLTSQQQSNKQVKLLELIRKGSEFFKVWHLSVEVKLLPDLVA